MSLRRTIARRFARRDHQLDMLELQGLLPDSDGLHAVTSALAGNTSRSIRRRTAAVVRENAAKVARHGALSPKQAEVLKFLKAQPDQDISTEQREHLAKLSSRVVAVSKRQVVGIECYVARHAGQLRENAGHGPRGSSMRVKEV